MTTWAELTAELASLLEALRQPSHNVNTAAQLCERAEAFSYLAGRFADGAPPPSASQADEMCRLLRVASERLAVLHGRLCAAPEGSDAALYTSVSSFSLALVCSLLAGQCHPPAAVVLPFCRSAARLLMGQLRKSGASANQEEACAIASLFDLQLRALATAFGLATLCGAECMQPLADEAAPPDVLLAFLREASSLLLKFRSMRLPGRVVRTIGSAVSQFAAFLAGTLCQPEFAPHAAALQRDPQLQGSMLDLLLPALSAAAVALQLPPDRRARHSWASTTSLVHALVSPFLAGQPMDERLAAGTSDSLGFMRASAQLAARAPQDSPADLQTQEALRLCCALASALNSQPSRALLALILRLPQGPRAADQVLAALPGLRGALRLAAAEAARDPAASLADAQQLCEQWRGLLGLLVDWCYFYYQEDASGASAAGLPELAAWNDAAATALQALPPLADLLQAHAAALQCPLDQLDWGTGLAAQLVELVAEAATLVFRAQGACTPGASGAEAAQAALWRLHTTACRAVHWMAAGGAPRQLLHPLLVRRSDGLLAALSNAVNLYDRLQGSSSAPSRPVQAMAVAHFAALQALSDSGVELQTRGNETPSPLINLTAVAQYLQRGLPLLPSLSTAAAWALRAEQAMLAADAKERLPTISGVLHNVCESARLAAVLVAEGVLEGLVQELAAAERAPVPAALLEWSVQYFTALQLLLRCARSLADASSELGPTGDALATAVRTAVDATERNRFSMACSLTIAQRMLPPARQLAAALLEWWRRPEQAAEDGLELAHAAAARSCAYLGCANLAGEGGPAAGQGAGSLKCSACRAVWYCSTTCSHADWRGPGGHRRFCRALGAARQQQRQQQRQAGAAGGAVEGVA